MCVVYSSYVSLQLDFKYMVDLTMHNRQSGKTKKQRTNPYKIGDTVVTHIHTFRECIFFYQTEIVNSRVI